MPNEKKKTHKARTGFALATIAAGLVAAAAVFLRKRGIKPVDEAKKVRGTAKEAEVILKGETKQAYAEIRQAVVDELTKSKGAISKPIAERTIRKVLAIVRKHGNMTARELKPLGERLSAEWKAIVAAAKQQKTTTKL